MPIHYDEFVSPAGRACVRMQVSGEIDLADAEEYAARFGEGGPYHLKPTLAIAARGTEYTAEARKRFQDIGEHGPHALVTTSPLVRAAVNLMTRLSGKGARFRMFAAEAEALAWLDQQER